MLVNGVPADTISIRDRGLLYGDGVFRTFIARAAQVPHWPLHCAKLIEDAGRLGIQAPPAAQLETQLAQLLADHPDCVLKIMLTRGRGQRGYTPDPAAEASCIWDVSPLPDQKMTQREQGVLCGISDICGAFQPRLAGIKHLNRLENVLAAEQCARMGWDEALMLDAEGSLISGTRTNLFLRQGDVLLTPDLSRCGVSGVQRARILAWAEVQARPVRITPIGLPQLLEADEVFLSNSVLGLWPVRELAGQCWTDFPLSRALQTALFQEFC